MHKEILNTDQLELLALVRNFKPEFFLVGGTAIALHIGHRRSNDFDLFKNGELRHKKILDTVKTHGFPVQVTRRVSEQLNLTISGVKFTFFDYPFPIKPVCVFENVIELPDILTLAAMKAYALSRRSKWKDYVDLYFIIRHHHSIAEISAKAGAIFGELFSEKMFRAQLSFFEDIDFTEPLEYLPPAVPETVIREFLVERATAVI
ncbi:MAG: nucleotidyl transferase AbiEii/AbiGii toxin family protein [Acidobacteria bacterium]|nr:nucleotidyl transferase AbiEii/AbiGii toxin family protein [Acidobacteriota bacterium]MBU4307909.1 nucleotidyl transferase AbiEii/AbiGii toxin family protein [Acidobacteriota bacterium]MBU4405922.1 nucleotidyl transferase AbiEii/AbiGii toxin family protein [Acidobacteriota bacterium]MCG2811047.1 nucleotidyl transferase AbiEii/AbiGii toxin family protein [Candidatus Aminicenantes bacterium]